MENKKKLMDKVSNGPVERPTTNAQQNTTPPKDEKEMESPNDQTLTVAVCAEYSEQIVELLKNSGLSPAEAFTVLNMAVKTVTWHLFQSLKEDQAGAEKQDGYDGMYH